MDAIRPNAEIERLLRDQTLLLQGLLIELREIKERLPELLDDDEVDGLLKRG